MHTHTKPSAFRQAYVEHLRQRRKEQRQRRYRAKPTFWETIQAIKAERRQHQTVH